MKPFLITTGTLFGLMTVVHVWRAIVEWPHPTVGLDFLLKMGALIVIPAVLSWWSWHLLGKLSANQTRRKNANMPGKDSDGSAA